MPKALILVADGSEEIEFVTPYDGESELDGRTVLRGCVADKHSLDAGWV